MPCDPSNTRLWQARKRERGEPARPGTGQRDRGYTIPSPVGLGGNCGACAAQLGQFQARPSRASRGWTALPKRRLRYAVARRHGSLRESGILAPPGNGTAGLAVRVARPTEGVPLVVEGERRGGRFILRYFLLAHRAQHVVCTEALKRNGACNQLVELLAQHVPASSRLSGLKPPKLDDNVAGFPLLEKFDGTRARKGIAPRSEPSRNV